MALSYRTRRRLSALILVVLLPVYIGFAWWLMSLFERPSILVELLVYLGLGIAWALPLKRVFLGVGQADPDAPPADGAARDR
ncbi:MAG: DUF2842 domain-containing protein [Hasllibacter sp.]